MAPPSCCPCTPPVLMEELVEEILLRIPPDEPAHLFRAALVCKPWRHIILDPGFLRRYRTFHRAPPLLGYFHNLNHRKLGPIAEFISTTATYPPPLFPLLAADNCTTSLWVLDCRHGRVLFQDTLQFIVWDPITDDQKKLSLPYRPYAYCTYGVLCAIDGCNHLDCHAGPFLVVYCGMTRCFNNSRQTWATIYSSETGVWSAFTSIDVNHYVDSRLTLLLGNAFYFSLEDGVGMLKYDLRKHELSVMSTPGGRRAVAMELDDGGLGFVAVDPLDNCMYVWSWQADANNGIGSWEQLKLLTELELETLLPRDNPWYWHEVTGWMEGTHIIFVSIDAGVFTLDLKSKKVKKVGAIPAYYQIKPYLTFYTPGMSSPSKPYRR